MEKEFVVIKSTSSKNGGFVNTVEHTSTVEVFGAKKTTKHRLLIKTDTELAEGLVAKLNLADFNITAREGVADDGRVITSRWLHRKVEA